MRNALSYLRRGDWDKLQSMWVLPTARRLYLIGALGAVIVTALALVAALVLHLISLAPTPQSPVPAVPTVTVKPIDPANLDALFKGPQAISIEPIPVVRPVGEGTPVGRFSAQSPWGMAETDGFQLVGGRDMAQFREAPDPARSGSTVLVATQALADNLRDLPATSRTKPFEVRVLGKDANGNLSQPTFVRFAIEFGQAAAPATDGADDGTTVQDLSAPEQLQRVVTALARLAGEPGSPEYFSAYSEARDEPSRCGAADNPQFDGAYIAAFDHVRGMLTSSNVRTFYRGLCEAWDQQLAVAHEEVRRLEASREELIASNAAAQLEGEIRRSGAKALRDVAIGFAVSAIGFFMVVSLFLAFLAIESHSNALRLAVESLARERRGDDA
jgi:hypothetical protein